MVTASEAREPDALRDGSNRLSGGPRPSCSHRAPPDDHHAFQEDAKPGELGLQFPPISWAAANNCGYDGGAKQLTLPCVGLPPEPDEFAGNKR